MKACCLQHILRISTCLIPRDYRKNKKFWEELMASFPWDDTGNIENDMSNNSSIVG
jgi:hypothetical protein